MNSYDAFNPPPAVPTVSQPNPQAPAGWGAYSGQYRVPPQPQWYPPQPAPPAFRLKRKDPRKQGARLAVNQTAAIVLVQSLLSVLISFVMLAVYWAMPHLVNDDLATSLYVSALSPLATALPAVGYLLICKSDWNMSLRFEKVGFFPAILWVFAGLGLSLTANYPAQVVDALLKGMGAHEPAQVLGQGDGWVNFAVELFGVAILVPIVEEFAFRGVIFSALQKHGTGFAVVGSALIFGMAHLQLSSVVFAFIAGLGMALVYAKTRNLWLTAVIHALNNGISIIESYTHLLGLNQAQSELLATLLMIVPVALGTVSFIILLIIGHRKKQARQEAQPPVSAAPTVLSPLNGGETAVCLLTSPLLWGLFVLSLAQTLMMFL